MAESGSTSLGRKKVGRANRARAGGSPDPQRRARAFRKRHRRAFEQAEKEFRRLQRDVALAGWAAKLSDLGLYIQDYRVKYAEVDRLYEMAKRDQWNPSTRFAPEEGPDFDDVKAFPVRERVAGARVLSDFYWGEQGAQIISSQLVSMVRENEARNFLSTQTMDEARHVEVFQKMLQQLDQVYPMNPYLRLLLNDIYRSDWVIEKMMGMNLFVEGLALSAFREAMSLHKDRHLDEVLRLIMKDESRHVGFGVKYLAPKLKRLLPHQKLRLQGKQLLWAFLLERSVRTHQREAEVFGVDLVGVVKQILRDHRDRVQEMASDALIDTRPIEKAMDFLFGSRGEVPQGTAGAKGAPPA